MDIYDPDTVFSSIDVHGRYAYKNQPNMASWNICRFAETLLPLIGEDIDRAIDLAQKVINKFIQHILDIWQWLFGMPESIYAVIPYGKYNDFMVDDEATLLMEYPQQRTATFILSTGEGSYTERLEIVGTKGTALLEEDTLTLHTYTPDTETYRRTADCTERQQLTETTTTEQFAPQAEPYPEMLANFADAILHGTPLTAPGVEGVRALELTDAAYLSAWLGEKLTLPLDADRFEQELQKHIQEEQTNG